MSMSARTTLRWDLLDLDGDPVPGDPDRVKTAQERYAKIAKTIHDTADNLRKVTGTDGLKGQYADAIRDQATDVVNDLTKASGRYDAVATAVGVYLPALQHARDETAVAVHDAENANAAQTKAHAMPDPSANRPPDAQPLSQADQDAVRDRNKATAAADSDLAAAKTRLHNAVEALNAAGQALEKAVGKNAFKNDHLTDSGWDKFLHGFNKFLKVLVKVLQWIGVALAALALIIPGVNVLVLASVVVAATILVADIILAAQGEASWREVGIAAAGVVLLGLGGALAKGLQKVGDKLRPLVAQISRNTARPAIENNLAMEMPEFLAGTSNYQTAEELMQAVRTGPLAQAEATGAGMVPRNPEWWQLRNPNYWSSIRPQIRDNNIVALVKGGRFAEYPKFFGGVEGVTPLGAAAGAAGLAPTAWYYSTIGVAVVLKGLGYASFVNDILSGSGVYNP
jgi:hypothetical protein